jgi:DNA modification methylase
VVGDATSQDTIEAALGARKASVVLSDPPYGLGDSKTKKNNYDRYVDSVENLDKLIAGFLPLARAAADVVVLTPGVINHRRYPAPTWTMAWFTPAGTGTGPWGFCCWQPILCYGKDPKLARAKGRHPDAIVHTESSNKNAHPCSKPTNFWKWLMERVSEPGDCVLEPFLGSGTALIAAELSGRWCAGIEISPAYVDASIMRWQKFTDKVAVHEKTGEPFPS